MSDNQDATNRIKNKIQPRTTQISLQPGMSVQFMREYHPTDGYIEALAQELLDWAENDEEALIIGEFFMRKKLFRESVLAWRKQFPLLESAYKEAMTRIGYRREKGALKKNLDSQMVRIAAHMYSDEWDAINQYHKELKKDENSTKQEINLHFDAVPESPLVKKLNKSKRVPAKNLPD